MSRRAFHVDAFTESVFSGNPAAVVLLDALDDAEWMQRVAAEMNLSETAFLAPSGGGFDLRWFTPAVEVDLCGHATLASAHVLWTEQFADPADAIVFHTRSGDLTCRSDQRDIWMDFPAKRVEPTELPTDFTEVVGAEPKVVSSGEVGGGGGGYLIELATADEVRGLRPDLRRLGELPDGYLLVTARASSDDHDFVSRFFAPAAGIDEDPVTGSAHCALGPYWAKALGRDELVGHQVSARGGVVRVRVDGDRVHLGGRAVTVLRGELDAG